MNKNGKIERHLLAHLYHNKRAQYSGLETAVRRRIRTATPHQIRARIAYLLRKKIIKTSGIIYGQPIYSLSPEHRETLPQDLGKLIVRKKKKPEEE